ncbi:MAG: preprotein translocase subunit YajC [Flavipsychrobacter sp.]
MTANLDSILLQAPAGGGGMQLLFIGGMVVVMYFFMIRPQAKRAKEQKKFSEAIGVGEHIVTAAGIHGTIKRVNEDGTLHLEVNHGSHITVERSAISMEMTNAHKKRTEPKPVDSKK